MSKYEKTLDMIFGRWRSQVLYVGVKLGVFECVTSMIKDGKQNAFPREYGKNLFEFTDSNPPYRKVFDEAMSSYSSIQTTWVSEALDRYDFSNVDCVCDVGGDKDICFVVYL